MARTGPYGAIFDNDGRRPSEKEELELLLLALFLRLRRCLLSTFSHLLPS
jgi:hypothetical protein